MNGTTFAIGAQKCSVNDKYDNKPFIEHNEYHNSLIRFVVWFEIGYLCIRSPYFLLGHIDSFPFLSTWDLLGERGKESDKLESVEINLWIFE